MDVSSREIVTQKWVIQLFRDRLGYTYLGDWHERSNNRYGTIETREKYYLTWKEENPDYNPQRDVATNGICPPLPVRPMV